MQFSWDPLKKGIGSAGSCLVFVIEINELLPYEVRDGKMRKLVIFLALAVVLIPDASFGMMDWCGWEETREGSAGGQDFGPGIKAKFIIVGFDEDPCDPTLYHEKQLETVKLI